MRRALTFLTLAATIGTACGGSPPLDPPPASGQVTQQTFAATYRAAKEIQAAISVGVTYVKLGELIQALATEVAIASDHRLNDHDKALLGKYAEILLTYKSSAEQWKHKIDGYPPAEAEMQALWTKADGMMDRATRAYYGRPEADGKK